ncbi:MAG: FixH family protein [Bacteroidota bacterium]|nr:FixH family protein [Bacteroidota bacterium]
MSWGIKITGLYLGFVALILTLVIVSSSQKMELESKDYYAQELKYQDRIDAVANTNSLPEDVNVLVGEKQVTIEFPIKGTDNKVSGKIWFYSAANMASDKHFEIASNIDGKQVFSRSVFNSGSYKVRVTWSVNGKEYFSEKSVNL